MSVEFCVYCSAAIMWNMTRAGVLMPFEYPPIAAEADLGRDGWVPGSWRVNGRRRTVFAPLSDSSKAKQERVSMVVMLHACAQAARDAAS